MFSRFFATCVGPSHVRMIRSGAVTLRTFFGSVVVLYVANSTSSHHSMTTAEASLCSRGVKRSNAESSGVWNFSILQCAMSVTAMPRCWRSSSSAARNCRHGLRAYT